jgi:hypothetical protein
LLCLPPPQAPPEEAVDACASPKVAGDTCSFLWKDEQVSGVCRPEPDGNTLVCAPLCVHDH